jgi:hypothetical protein
MQHPDIEKQGANARALNSSFVDNPYYKPVMMPAATGETIESWHDKAVAWNLGWSIEDSMRSEGLGV